MADESQGYCLNEHFHDEVKKDERTQNLYTENEKHHRIKYQNKARHTVNIQSLVTVAQI